MKRSGRHTFSQHMRVKDLKGRQAQTAERAKVSAGQMVQQRIDAPAFLLKVEPTLLLLAPGIRDEWLRRILDPLAVREHGCPSTWRYGVSRTMRKRWKLASKLAQDPAARVQATAPEGSGSQRVDAWLSMR